MKILTLPSYMTESEITDMHINVVNNMGGLPVPKKIQCPYCDAKLPSYNLLKDHTISAHNQGIPSTKAVFDKVFLRVEEVPKFLEKEEKIPENTDHGIVIGAEYMPTHNSMASYSVIFIGESADGMVRIKPIGKDHSIEISLGGFKRNFEIAKTTPDIQVGDIYRVNVEEVEVEEYKDNTVFYSDPEWGIIFDMPRCSFLDYFTFVRHADTQESVPVFDYDIPIGNYIAMDKCKRWGTYRECPINNEEYWYGGDIIGTEDCETLEWPDWKESLFLSTENGLVKV